MKPQFAILAIAVLVFATGCQQAPTAESTQPMSIGQPTLITYSAPESYVVPNGDTLADAERYFDLVAEPLFGTIQRYNGGAILAADFDKEARDIIAGASEEAFYPSAAQEVSHNALHYLLQDESAKLDAIAWHTEMLVKYDSPHADVISEALDMLEGHWTDEQIKKAAEEAIVNAEAWLVGIDERMHIHMPEDGRDAVSTAAKDMLQLAE